MSATYQVRPSGETLTSCGIEGTPCGPLRCSSPTIRLRSTSTLSRSPENSQLTIMYLPSAEKSAWLTPEQGTRSVARTAMECGSRNTISCCASAITTAYRPSGVKYRLYGSCTGTGLPKRPVTGSIGKPVPVQDPYNLYFTPDGPSPSEAPGTW